MSGAKDSGFTRALGLAATAAGALSAYALMPEAFAATEAWVTKHTMAAYGPENLDWLLIAWQGLLAVLIFALVRGALYALSSLTGLALAMLLVRRKERGG